jgi:predicted DCC family thiol-disulfide oxidoreductase YuxK
MSECDSRPDGDIRVIYDGECPFCSRYVLLYCMRATGRRVHLVDARSGDPSVQMIKDRGFDIDAGMVVLFGGRIYWGPEAMNILAILGSGGTAFNALNRILFRHLGLARALYPVLVRGRILVLRILGRRLIGENS